MNVVVTGATGTVGTAIVDYLGSRPAYEFTGIDIRERADTPGGDGAGIDCHVADVTEYEAVRPLLEGADAVIHLAVTAEASDRLWSEIFKVNLKGTAVTLQAALDAGVGTFVFASSIHAFGMYEIEHRPEIYEPDFPFVLDRSTPFRPDSTYGVAKMAGEGLLRYCTEDCGIRGRVVRIGAVRPRGADGPYSYAEEGVEVGRFERGSEAYVREMKRIEGLWQSRRDFAHMIDRILQDDTGGFDIYYGVSDNDRRWVDISHAREAIGYSPRDSADDGTGPLDR